MFVVNSYSILTYFCLKYHYVTLQIGVPIRIKLEVMYFVVLAFNLFKFDKILKRNLQHIKGKKMYEEKIKDLLSSTLAVDSFCLGLHWIYDKDELDNLDIDWDNLNAPKSSYHKGKSKGDFTHYGDQIIILNNFLKDKDSFNVQEYTKYWRNEMNDFKGYMDGSTKDTIANIDNNMSMPCGSSSGDMSIVGRIIPLLKVSKTEKEFIQNVKIFAQATHNNIEVIEAINFFAMLLLEVLKENDIEKSILELQKISSKNIQDYINIGIKSKNEDTISFIRKIGSSCPSKFAFPSIIHLLLQEKQANDIFITNAKAGGDSSARAMVVAFLLVARDGGGIIPKQWVWFVDNAIK